MNIMMEIVTHLQNENLKRNIQTRNQIKQTVRNFLNQEGFLEIDTPILGPQIPEYTNDQFRVMGKQGEEYYLPQSPQIYKQILMCAGYKKYFQFAHCFRYGEYDDSHINEFMQIDVEMHVSIKETLMQYVEQIVKSICDDLHIPCSIPFPIISGSECIYKYGTDKPDLRKNANDMSFLWIVDLPMLEKINHFGRIKVVSANIEIDKVAYILSHHAFAMPLNWSKNITKFDLLNVLTDSFDLVLNGIEVCSGDIRINNRELQEDIFEKLGICTKYYTQYLNLLNPKVKNGGFALGIERLVMALHKSGDIKETNAFFDNWYLEKK